MMLTSKNKIRKIRAILLGALGKRQDSSSCGLCYYYNLQNESNLFFNSARATRVMVLQHPFMFNFLGLKFPLNKNLFFDHSSFKDVLTKLLKLRFSTGILVIFFYLKGKMILNLPSLILFNLFEDSIFIKKIAVIKIFLRPFQIK